MPGDMTNKSGGGGQEARDSAGSQRAHCRDGSPCLVSWVHLGGLLEELPGPLSGGQSLDYTQPGAGEAEECSFKNTWQPTWLRGTWS